MWRAALLLVAVLVAGCGAERPVDRPNEAATLLLDFTPNPVHAGIFLADARAYDDAEGVRLRVRAPSASTDALKLLRSGRAELALLSITDLALAREQGVDVVGVMALVQRPLASVIAQPGVRSPRALEGRRVGVSGLPSDVAVLRSIVDGAGGDADEVRRVTIGFNAVPALLGRRVAAATAFWNAEGVALRRRRPGMRIFRVDEYGAPAYPELVLVATGRTLDEEPAVVRATVAALRRGYEETITDPPSALTALLERAQGLERAEAARQLDAVLPTFTAGAPQYGWLDPDRLRDWARWARRFGVVEREPDVGATFAPRFANASED